MTDVKQLQQLHTQIAAPETSIAKPSPLTGSERVRRTRDRKRRGIMFLGIEILPNERDALIRLGFLNRIVRNDKKAVREALYRFFESDLDRETPPPQWSR